MTIGQTTALPTWLLVRALRPFLSADHPWKDRKFTLREWAEGETPFSRASDFVLWLYFIGVPAVWLMLR